MTDNNKRSAADPLHLEDDDHKKRLKKASQADPLLCPTAERQSKSFNSPRRHLTAKIDRTNDVIHSSIDICAVTKALMDSRPMQRLRKVQQLATADYVYMNCTHTRFEHSLGVAHLAERLCKRIKTRQDNLGCTSKDILCVKLAGLLHDVGHGPFSHTYEDFVHKVLPEYLERHPSLLVHYEGQPPLPDKNFKHESVSLMMIDAALASRGLKINLQKLDDPLEEIGGDSPSYIAAKSMRVFNKGLPDDQAILTSRDFVFIKECIWGGPVPDINPTSFVGREDPHKEFLYDIVSNRHSGLDVDKIDYFARDRTPAFKGSGEIDKLMIEEAVVAWGACTEPGKCVRCKNGDTTQKHLMICYPEKVVGAAMAFFKQRHTLHKTLYRHKKTDAVGYMVCDIMCYADPFFRLVVPPELREAGGSVQYEDLSISRATLDVQTFLRLRDSIVDLIANTRDENLRKARGIIHRLEEGDLYKTVGTKKIDMKNYSDQKLWSLKDAEIMEQMVARRDSHDNGVVLDLDDIIVEHCSIHCGCKDVNPLSRMRFLKKEQMSKIDSVSICDLPEAQVEDEANYEADIPRTFQENSIRVFCKESSKCELASHVFSQWLEEQSATGIQTALLEEDPSRPMAGAPQDGAKKMIVSSVTPPPRARPRET